MTSVSLRDSTAIARNAGPPITSIVFTKPTLTQAGDQMIMVLWSFLAAAQGITPPSGWAPSLATQQVTAVTAGGWWHVFGKIAGASEPSTYTWVMDSGIAFYRGRMLSYSGVDTSAPIVGAQSTKLNAQASGASVNLTNTTNIGFRRESVCLSLFGGFGEGAGTHTFSWAEDVGTELFDDDGGGSFMQLAVSSQSLHAAGQSTTVTGTFTSAMATNGLVMTQMILQSAPVTTPKHPAHNNADPMIL